MDIAQFKQLCLPIDAETWASMIVPAVSKEQFTAWKDGIERVPESVVQQILYFKTTAEMEVQRMVEEAYQQGLRSECFIYYSSDDHLRLYDSKTYSLFGNAHFHYMLLWKVRGALSKIGCSTLLVLFLPESYRQWLKERKFQDSPSNRKLWGKLTHRPLSLEQAGLATKLDKEIDWKRSQEESDRYLREMLPEYAAVLARANETHDEKIARLAQSFQKLKSIPALGSRLQKLAECPTKSYSD